MPTIGIHFKPLPSRRQAGLSLIELMISITIGLILLVGITTLIVQQSSNRDELEKASRQIENGRYAMQVLHDDIQLAGLFGAYNPVAASTVVQTTPADPCNINLGSTFSGWDNSASSVPTAIFGYYQPATGASADPTTATTCGLSNYKQNTSILVVRRTATIAASAVAGIPNLQTSGCNSESANMPFFYSVGAPATTLHLKDCSTNTLVLPYMVNVYYISSCDTVTAANVCLDTIPTLKMIQAGAPQPLGAATPPLTTIPLVEGIENMQFDYGLDTDGDGYPDTYTNNPAAGNNWMNVMAIRINLLARNTDPTTGYQSGKTFCMSGAPPLQASGVPATCNVGGAMLVGPFPDTFKRHLFSELVRVVNPSARRALQ